MTRDKQSPGAQAAAAQAAAEKSAAEKSAAEKCNSFSGQQIHFVTGRLAEFAVKRELESLSKEVGFSYTVDVLPITVAALMSPGWISRHIQVPPGTDRVVVPGYCDGDLTVLEKKIERSVDVGRVTCGV